MLFWSLESVLSRVSLGLLCWNGRSYKYSYKHGATLSSGPAVLVLCEQREETGKW
jgi:hypothetical protein